MVNRCGETWVQRGVGGVVNRCRTWVNRCGETWSTGAGRGSTGAGRVVNRCRTCGQQVRRNVESGGELRRGQPVRRDVVSRCGETWSAGAARRGQPVRRDVVSRCGETWSAGAARRGQPVRRDVVSRCGETWSAGAGNAVSRCGKCGQQVRGTRSTGAAKHCFRQCSQGFVNPARSSRSPRSFPERGEGREPVAACFAADAARRHRMLLHTGLSHR